MSKRPISLLVVVMMASWICTAPIKAQGNFRRVIEDASRKVVKIVGSGGFQGLEPYQTGVVISSDGLVLTVWSYVLDQDQVSVTTADGVKSRGQLIGYDPRLQIALLKIDRQQIPHFNLDLASEVRIGHQVLAFSNLYKIATGDEPVSAQFGYVSAIGPLMAKQGTQPFQVPGSVYFVDAMTNNPGAAGGVLTNRRGEILGILGKEVRSSTNNAWINFAIPIATLADSVANIQAGKMSLPEEVGPANNPEPVTLELLGLRLVPNVVSRTPPFVDRVDPSSSAGRAGILTDDLLVEIANRVTPTVSDVERRLVQMDRDATVRITVQRGNEFLTFELKVD